MGFKTKTLIDTTKEQYRRSYASLSNHLTEHISTYGITIHNIGDYDFKSVSGILSSFFDEHNILVSVIPNNILNKKSEKTKHLWSYLMYIDKTEIVEGDFQSREIAEYIAFLKAFQFLDTKLFIEQTKERFFDESSDISCLKMNWDKLNEVLSYKRKNLKTILD